LEIYPDEDIKVELKLDKSKNIKVSKVSGKTLLTKRDKENFNKIGDRFLDYRDKYMPIYEMSLEEYVPFAIESRNNRIDYALKDIRLSKAAKIWFSNELKLFHLIHVFMAYESNAKLSYLNANHLDDVGDWLPQEPDLNYYTFLKDFDLNNPQRLYNVYYSEVIQCILFDKVLNIPLILETSVPEWLTEVKTILIDLVGFESGQFYDLLAANAYSKQYINIIPLSDKQKENIKNYFKDDKAEIAKILLRKNEEVIRLAEQKDPLDVNETFKAAKEKLIDTIISKHKGKVRYQFTSYPGNTKMQTMIEQLLLSSK
jgi:hypothetical protein